MNKKEYKNRMKLTNELRRKLQEYIEEDFYKGITIPPREVIKNWKGVSKTKVIKKENFAGKDKIAFCPHCGNVIFIFRKKEAKK